MSECGYCKLQLDRSRYHWLITVTSSSISWANQGSQRCNAWAGQGSQQTSSLIAKAWYVVANAICQAFFWLARWAVIIFANGVNFFWLLITNVVWMACRLIFPGKKRRDRIKHVFVVMLENRSFDHMLGLSNIQGSDARSGQPTTLEGLNASNNWNEDAHGNRFVATSPAAWVASHDPGHSLAEVQEQLCGAGGKYPHINNSGFVTCYSHINPEHPGEIMQCYAPDQLPIMTTLAQEFAVCDHWFSSVPGPTWPNRLFVHAASSGGLDDSPSHLSIVSAVLFNGYKFDNGTIFDRLDDEGLDWTIYKGDAFPQSLAISGMTAQLLAGRFRDFEDFSSDVNDAGYTASYAFIEPNYGHLDSDFTCGDSQHPKDDVTRGEKLLKTIYETIRNSPHWESSVLIITYDEHGGFYDHVPPPQTVAPGDSISDPENNQHNFDFKQLGVRVPAVIISPLIPRGVIDHTVYDHSSILATIENIFGLQSLTQRDKHANTFKHLFSLSTARTDAPSILPEAAVSGIICEDDEEAIAGMAMSPPEAASMAPARGATTNQPDVHVTQEGTGAASMAPARGANTNQPDVHVTQDTGGATTPLDPSLRGFVHVAFLRDLQVSPPKEKEDRTAQYLDINTHRDALQYINEVRQKIEPTESK